jgi:Ca2+-binding RTX toxin-like protein
MTTTPTVWKSEFTVNAGLTTGSQFTPVTVGLADDRFLTVWVDDANHVDDDAGNDIIGRIFDAQGVPVGPVFQLNLSTFLDNENDPAIVALPDGGFVVVFEDRAAVAGDAAIRFARFNSAGVSTASGTIATGTIGGIENSNPSIAVRANGDFVVTYQQLSGGDTDVLGKVVNGVTNVPGAAFDAGQNSADFDGNPDTSILSNGNIVTVCEEDDGAVRGVEYRIHTPGGVLVDGSLQIANAGTGPRVAALVGGGFAVVYEDAANTGDIRAEIRSNAGAVVTANFLVQGGANSQNEPDIVALKDGGFFVVWDDDTLEVLRGLRFDATGTAIGSAFTIATGSNITNPELGLTDDGRILVTFENAADEIGQVILDPRDNIIQGDATHETITSRIDGATVNGFGGNDTLLGQAAVDVLNGGIGGDNMKGGQSNDIYWVDNGSDIVNETGGGAGIDNVNSFITFSLADAVHTIGAVENLNLKGTLNFAGTGNGLNNVITGNTGNNTLTGNAGADALKGVGGADTLIGGHGIDTLTGGIGNDSFVLNAPLNVANRDVVTDFTNVAGNNDTFRLENAVMPGLGAAGGLAAAKFFAGAAAHDADDRIVYNQVNGNLFYDSNGNAAGGSTLIATITNKPLLTAGDFVVI